MNKDDTLRYHIHVEKFQTGILSLDDDIPFESPSWVWLPSFSDACCFPRENEGSVDDSKKRSSPLQGKEKYQSTYFRRKFR